MGRRRSREELSARFRKLKDDPQIYDSQVTLQVVSYTRWLLDYRGLGHPGRGRNYVRVFLQAETRADDGMELTGFESYDAASFGFAGQDLRDLREGRRHDDRGPQGAVKGTALADPYIGPAILEGCAPPGVFFHEILGHRAEGHRQKNEDEGQTFAKQDRASR